MLKIGEMMELSGRYSAMWLLKKAVVKRQYDLLVYDAARSGWFVLADGNLATVRRSAKLVIEGRLN